MVKAFHAVALTAYRQCAVDISGVIGAVRHDVARNRLTRHVNRVRFVARCATVAVLSNAGMNTIAHAFGVVGARHVAGEAVALNLNGADVDFAHGIIFIPFQTRGAACGRIESFQAMAYAPVNQIAVDRRRMIAAIDRRITRLWHTIWKPDVVDLTRIALRANEPSETRARATLHQSARDRLGSTATIRRVLAAHFLTVGVSFVQRKVALITPRQWHKTNCALSARRPCETHLALAHTAIDGIASDRRGVGAACGE